MIINFFIFSLFIYFSSQIIISNGVYNLIIQNFYLQYHKRKVLTINYLKHPNTFFRIQMSYKNYFYIEEISTKYQLIYLETKELIFTKKKEQKINLWEFIKTNNNKYIIKNINNCFVKFQKPKIICDNIPSNEATEFDLIRIYNEILLDSPRDKEILEKEPIDVIIKYIDLKDPNLHREGIHQIQKDYDNEELRYSIRSILKNIPWIRKIFILMPNKRIRYFKDYKLIKEKIIYVKDRDLIGFDSSSSLAFQFRFWKMKEFGISDNFIVMDDDCFIGKRIEKKDFFYVEKGKVVPSIITSKFIQIKKNYVKKYCKLYKYKAKNSRAEQNADIFNYSRFLTYLFVLNIFNITTNNPIFIPRFTHNAIPCNLKEIREIYDIINMSDYKSTTLDSLYRKIDSLQFQTLVLSYTFIKYNKRVNDIPSKYIRIRNSISANYDFPLFCINTGAGKYSDITFYQTKIIMEKLFPIPTQYEIVDYSFQNLSFKLVYSMNKIIINYEKELKLIRKKNSFKNQLILILLLALLKMFIKKKFILDKY